MPLPSICLYVIRNSVLEFIGSGFFTILLLSNASSLFASSDVFCNCLQTSTGLLDAIYARAAVHIIVWSMMILLVKK
jgi:hypothetical protein